jgi:WD40 repeat protein
LAFSPDGRYLATVAQGSEITLWDWRTGRMYTQFGGGRSSFSYGSTLAFTPSGTILLFAHDRRIEQWDLTTTPVVPYVHPIVTDYYINNIIITSDGRFLIAAEMGGPLEVRYLRPADWVKQACSVAGRNLTRNEWSQFVGDNMPYHKTCSEFP